VGLFHKGFGLTLCATFLLSAPLARASQESERFVALSRRLDLSRSPEWRRLVHYRPTSGAHVVSDVDGTEFFLASRGKEDPEAELEATIRAFFTPPEPGKDDEHARCRFPARFFWLNEKLSFDVRLMNAPVCEDLSRYDAPSIESVSVVYASTYLENPASAFGHIFLHLRRRRPAAAPGPCGEDYGAEYAAAPDTANPVLYVVGGLTGSFAGQFKLQPFESKLREYSDVQARDLWEYDLALTRREITLLTSHLWELSATHIDFFYLTGNCAFQVLAALEASSARLDLLSHLRAPILPADAIKVLATAPGLVRSVGYRPSSRTRVERSFEPVRPAADACAGLLGDHPAPLPAATELRTPWDKAPSLQHGTMRILLGTGATSQYGEAFVTVGYRLALHDLVDPPAGEPELSQLEFLDTRLRYDVVKGLTLDTLTFADALALNPISRFETALSWRARAFGVRLHDRGCPDGFAHGVDGAVGAAVATPDKHLAAFLMAEAYVALSGQLDGIGRSWVRVGAGPYAGLRARLPGQTVGLVTGSWSYLPAQSLAGTYDLRAALRGQIAPDVALGINAAVQPLSVEAQLASYFYF
jgi:Domain of unknown function (DUF4105)